MSETFDFSSVKDNISKAEAAKSKRTVKKDTKKPPVSYKPLVFVASEEDSPLKKKLIDLINSRDLTYSDLYTYCTTSKGGDAAEGQRLANNLISGLRNRHSMLDTTLVFLCEFLKLDIYLKDRPELGDKEV